MDQTERAATGEAIIERGERLYREKLKALFVPEHVGKLLAIDPVTERCFPGGTSAEAVGAAHDAMPDSRFYLKRVGYTGRRTLSAVASTRRNESGMSEPSRWESHQLLDEIALAYHRAVAERLRRTPEIVIEIARQNLARWLASDAFDGGTGAPLREWEAIIDRSNVEQLIAIITGESDEGQRLRSSSPFVGAIAEEERLEILHACEVADG